MPLCSVGCLRQHNLELMAPLKKKRVGVYVPIRLHRVGTIFHFVHNCTYDYKLIQTDNNYSIHYKNACDVSLSLASVTVTRRNGLIQRKAVN